MSAADLFTTTEDAPETSEKIMTSVVDGILVTGIEAYSDRCGMRSIGNTLSTRSKLI